MFFEGRNCDPLALMNPNWRIEMAHFRTIWDLFMDELTPRDRHVYRSIQSDEESWEGVETTRTRVNEFIESYETRVRDEAELAAATALAIIAGQFGGDANHRWAWAIADLVLRHVARTRFSISLENFPRFKRRWTEIGIRWDSGEEELAQWLRSFLFTRG